MVLFVNGTNVLIGTLIITRKEKSMMIYAEPIFLYRNVPETFKETLSEEFMRVRNLYADRLNVVIGDWNREFDSIYGKQENYMESDDYSAFIRAKVNRLIDAYPDWSSWITIMQNPHPGHEFTGDVVGKVNGLPDSEIDVMFKKVF